MFQRESRRSRLTKPRSRPLPYPKVAGHEHYDDNEAGTQMIPLGITHSSLGPMVSLSTSRSEAMAGRDRNLLSAGLPGGQKLRGNAKRRAL